MLFGILYIDLITIWRREKSHLQEDQKIWEEYIKVYLKLL